MAMPVCTMKQEALEGFGANVPKGLEILCFAGIWKCLARAKPYITYWYAQPASQPDTGSHRYLDTAVVMMSWCHLPVYMKDVDQGKDPMTHDGIPWDQWVMLR